MSQASKYVAEAIGTFALCFVGAGAICTATWKGYLGGADLVGIALAHGLILSIGISATMNVSGGHLNPAVTAAMLVTRRISIGDAIGYVASQLIGGVAAGALLFLIYDGLMTEAVPGLSGSGGASVISSAALGTPTFTKISATTAALVEVFTTFLLVFAVFGTAADPRAHKIGGFGIGMTLCACIFLAGPLTGAALNPARYFGTGIVAAVKGGMTTFWSQQWVYWVGPIAGGVLAGLIYDNLLMDKSARQPAELVRTSQQSGAVLPSGSDKGAKERVH